MATQDPLLGVPTFPESGPKGPPGDKKRFRGKSEGSISNISKGLASSLLLSGWIVPQGIEAESYAVSPKPKKRWLEIERGLGKRWDGWPAKTTDSNFNRVKC